MTGIIIEEREMPGKLGTEKRPGGHGNKAIFKPRREASGEKQPTNPAGTLILDFQPLEFGEYIYVIFKPLHLEFVIPAH